MRLVVECDHDGQVYVTLESNVHFKKAQRDRRDSGLESIPLSDLDKECCISPGTFVVAVVSDAQAEKVRGWRKNRRVKAVTRRG